MVFEHTPSDQVQLVGLGELLHPGKCMICGNGNCELGYVRLGIFYDYEGEQYLCATCLTQCAELIGCLTSEEANHLQDQAKALAASNKQLMEELENATERLDIFESAIRASLGDAVINAISSDLTKAAESSLIVDAAVTDGSEKSEPDTVEPVKGDDSTGVSESGASNKAGKSKPKIVL